MRLSLFSLKIHEEQVPMPASLTGVNACLFMHPSNTQLLNLKLNPLVLAGIKDVWRSSQPSPGDIKFK